MEAATSRLPNWHTSIETLTVEPGSSLAADDRVFTFDPVSHQVRSCMTFAVDHLETFHSLVTRAEVIPSIAGFTILRGAIESVAKGLWLIGPPQRTERALRAAQLAYESARDALQLQIELDGKSGRPAVDHPRLLRIIESATKTGRIDGRNVPRTPRLTSIMRDARAFEDQRVDLPLVALWRAASGLAHGRRDMMQLLTDHEVTDVQGDGFEMRITSSLSMLAGIYYVTERQLVRLLETVRQRGTRIV